MIIDMPILNKMLNPVITLAKSISNNEKLHLPYSMLTYATDFYRIEISACEQRITLAFKRLGAGLANDFDISLILHGELEDSKILSYERILRSTNEIKLFKTFSHYNGSDVSYYFDKDSFKNIKSVEVKDFSEEWYFQNTLIHSLPSYEEMHMNIDLYEKLKSELKCNFLLSMNYKKISTDVVLEDELMKRIWSAIPVIKE
ncbi:hypothetical protein ABV23_RS00080 [Escherichia coli]|nr:hypothetical protein [Escherichia coli]